jgi:hypothetical protein
LIVTVPVALALLGYLHVQQMAGKDKPSSHSYWYMTGRARNGSASYSAVARCCFLCHNAVF